MSVPTDLTGQHLANWCQDAMKRAQEGMGRYVVSAFGRQYENPLWRASRRRLFYMERRAYEEAKARLEAM